VADAADADDVLYLLQYNTKAPFPRHADVKTSILRLQRSSKTSVQDNTLTAIRLVQMTHRLLR